MTDPNYIDPKRSKPSETTQTSINNATSTIYTAPTYANRITTPQPRQSQQNIQQQPSPAFQLHLSHDNSVTRSSSNTTTTNNILSQSNTVIIDKSSGTRTPVQRILASIPHDIPINYNPKLLPPKFLSNAADIVSEEKVVRLYPENSKYSFLNIDVRRDGNGNRPGTAEYNERTLHIPIHNWNQLSLTEKQYFNVKRNNMDRIVLFKLGKFYEIFDDDAKICRSAINLHQMGKKGEKDRWHVGFPESAFKKYTQQLIDRGYQIVQVEQTSKRTTTQHSEQPVNRDIVAGYTTATNRLNVDESNGFMLAITEHVLVQPQSDITISPNVSVYLFGICILDLKLGSFIVGSFEDNITYSKLQTVLTTIQSVEFCYNPRNITPTTLKLIQSKLPTNCQLQTMLPLDLQPVNTPPAGFSYNTEFTIQQLRQYFTSNSTDNNVQQYADYPEPVVELLQTNNTIALDALGLIISALQRVKCDQCIKLKNFTSFDFEHIVNGTTRYSQCMMLTGQTLDNLEILTNDEGTIDGTLYKHIMHTKTPFGRRLLREWLCKPLLYIDKINERLDAVSELMSDRDIGNTFEFAIHRVQDMEGLLAQIHQLANPSDLDAIYYENVSTAKVHTFNKLLTGFTNINKMMIQLQQHQYGSTLLLKCITNSPPITELLQQFNVFTIKYKDADGNKIPNGELIINEGVNKDYDMAVRVIKETKDNLQTYLDQIHASYYSGAEYCTTLRNQYAVVFPKIGYNGKPLVVDKQRFTRHVSTTQSKQMYYTNDIIEMKEILKNAQNSKDDALKSTITDVFKQFISHYKEFKQAIDCCAELDCLLSLAYVSKYQNKGRSVRPIFVAHSENGSRSMIEIKQGVHPSLCGYDGTVTDIHGNEKEFIPNDVAIGTAEQPREFVIMTGANMGGKSTILRQTCQIAILAHIGCYVPASSCRITPIDRIFTRVGASDKIMSGQSTFMVEMNETSIILNQATSHSLVILDELGRGTSTFDGTAVAYAVIRHITERIGCMTLFTTHYQLLVNAFRNSDLVEFYKLHTIVGQNILGQTDLLFTYKFSPGVETKSRGLEVAEAMAGMPASIMQTARHAAAWMEEQMLTDTVDVQAVLKQYRVTVMKLYVDAKQAYNRGEWDVAVQMATEIQRLVKEYATIRIKYESTV